MSTLASTYRTPESRNHGQLIMGMARFASDMLEYRALLYDVFACKPGARLLNVIAGISHDRFGSYYHHVLVRDGENGVGAASTRSLTCEQALFAGGYYPEAEFDLAPILGSAGWFMEIDPTCERAGYRKVSAITVLWKGNFQFKESRRYDYLIGCASIGLHDGGRQVQAIMQSLRLRYLLPEASRVLPMLPYSPRPDDSSLKGQMPPLLKPNIRLGATIDDEPHWDRDLNVSDMFVSQYIERITSRYERHYQVALCRKPL